MNKVLIVLGSAILFALFTSCGMFGTNKEKLFQQEAEEIAKQFCECVDFNNQLTEEEAFEDDVCISQAYVTIGFFLDIYASNQEEDGKKLDKLINKHTKVFCNMEPF